MEYLLQTFQVQLKRHLLKFKEAVIGCSTRAECGDRVAAAMLKDFREGAVLLYDHGQRFMSVEEELEEMSSAELAMS